MPPTDGPIEEEEEEKEDKKSRLPKYFLDTKEPKSR